MPGPGGITVTLLGLMGRRVCVPSGMTACYIDALPPTVISNPTCGDFLSILAFCSAGYRNRHNSWDLGKCLYLSLLLVHHLFPAGTSRWEYSSNVPYDKLSR